jgi:hypothetical protein
MFSGHITEAELKHERPALYERMEKAGELQNFEPVNVWPRWQRIVKPFGIAAIIIGLSLAALIFWSVWRGG